MPKIRLRTGMALMAAGAALAYFLDPDRGRARRVRMRERSASEASSTLGRAEQRIRYQQGRVEGAAARAEGKGTFEPTGDRDLKDRVDQVIAELGPDTSKVTTEVVDGRVTLRGQLRTTDDIKKVEVEASAVPGVDRVVSHLHLPGTTAPNKADAVRAS